MRKPTLLLLDPEPSPPTGVPKELGEHFVVVREATDGVTAVYVPLPSSPDGLLAAATRAKDTGAPILIGRIDGPETARLLDGLPPRDRRRVVRALNRFALLVCDAEGTGWKRRLRFHGVAAAAPVQGEEWGPNDLRVPVRRPRVLLVGPIPPPVGGVESVTQSFLESELRRDYDLVHCDISRRQTKEKVSRVTLLNLFWAGFFTLRYMAKVAWDRPRVVHVPIVASPVPFARDAVFALWARLLGRRLVLHSHDGYLPEVYERSSKRRKRWMRFVYGRAHRLVCVSETWRRFFEKMRVPARMRVVHNPLDAGFREALARAGPRPDGPFTVLFVGAICKDKGVHDLLEAARLVPAERPDTRFVIVGPGRFPGEWDHMVVMRDRMGLARNVEMPGSVMGDELARAYRHADCFVLPTYKEGLPVVLLEAMAAGLPVVTTPVGGIPDLIEEGVNGFLVPPAEPEALAERILRLAADPGLREKMGAQNLAKVTTEYAQEAVAAHIAEVYREVME